MASSPTLLARSERHDVSPDSRVPAVSTEPMTVFTDGNDSTDRPDRVNRRGPTVASARPHHAGTKTEADLVSDLNVAARCSGGGHAARMADVIYVAERGVYFAIGVMLILVEILHTVHVRTAEFPMTHHQKPRTNERR